MHIVITSIIKKDKNFRGGGVVNDVGVRPDMLKSDSDKEEKEITRIIARIDYVKKGKKN